MLILLTTAGLFVEVFDVTTMGQNRARVMKLLEDTPARFTWNNLDLKSLDTSVKKLTTIQGEWGSEAVG